MSQHFSRTLVAAVVVACFVEGRRIDVQPGDELPPMSGHDEDELLKTGAAKDPELEAHRQHRREQEAELDTREFEEARRSVMAHQAAITPELAVSKDSAGGTESAAAPTSTPAAPVSAPTSDPAPVAADLGTGGTGGATQPPAESPAVTTTATASASAAPVAAKTTARKS